jgi:hypothetical protein
VKRAELPGITVESLGVDDDGLRRGGRSKPIADRGAGLGLVPDHVQLDIADGDAPPHEVRKPLGGQSSDDPFGIDQGGERREGGIVGEGPDDEILEAGCSSGAARGDEVGPFLIARSVRVAPHVQQHG